MTDHARTGGCQCGAVRFRVRGELGRASICHCRMCQKAFGGFFGPLVSAPDEASVEWTRSPPSYFQSSVNISRGFCSQCGTPLTYRHPGGIELSIGSFDDRDDLMPLIQVNFAARLPWVERIFDQPKRDAADDAMRQENVISFQHPDHDTPAWPSQGLKL